MSFFLRLVFFTLLLQFLSPAVIAGSKVAGLTQQIMQQRSNVVDDVAYELALDLVSSDDQYAGEVDISFNLLRYSPVLKIDFFRGQVEHLEINGTRSEQYNYDGQFIELPADSGQSLLKPGKNHILIRYRHDYADNSQGVYRFTDPVDQRTYIYTDFEPYNANQLFPMFDQPNLKATFEISVLAQPAWTVVSAVMPTQVEQFESYKRWFFPASPRISSYLFNISAGPFSVWQDRFQPSGQKEIKLRLFARQSLAKHVDAVEWFKVTRQGLKFFTEFFDTAYPFPKLDQIIVPDFNWGGMENVGAITYPERYIFKTTPTSIELEGRSTTILHELAHMWFGNLVTMEWWNDLWLNESFATLMSYLALNASKDSAGGWVSFYSEAKNWAYWSDQLVTTHPIEVTVKDTATAFTQFDGITYGKGAATLKQLHFYLGDDFKKGIRLYFKRHAWSNTRLEHFFEAMQDASGKDLSEWVDLWIRKAGLNRLEAEYRCQGGLITAFNLLQTAPEAHPYLRPHRTVIELYKRQPDGDHLQVYTAEHVMYQGDETMVTRLLGQACPALVFANAGDQDYIKLKLDARSLETVRKGILDIPDRLTRTMLWDTLWQMVRDGEWNLIEYIELALSRITDEPDFKIQQRLLERLSEDAADYLLQDHQHKRQNLAMIERMESFFWQKLQIQLAGSDAQRAWFDAFRHVAISAVAQQRLMAILQGELRIDGLVIGQRLRWKLIRLLNFYNYSGSKNLIKEELKQDSSNYARNQSVAAEAIRPDKIIKRKWMQKILDFDSDTRYPVLKAAIENLFPTGQEGMQAPFSDQFFKALGQLDGRRDNHFKQAFTRYLLPVFCDAASVRRITAYIEANPELPAAILKTMKISNQENERCMIITENISY